MTDQKTSAMERGAERMGKEKFHEAQGIMQGLADQSCFIEADLAPRGPEGGLCFR